MLEFLGFKVEVPPSEHLTTDDVGITRLGGNCPSTSGEARQRLRRRARRPHRGGRSGPLDLASPPDQPPVAGGERRRSEAAPSRTIELTPFTAADATRDLLGVPALSPARRGYLDMLGNHDGSYDLGDLLAFFDRHNIKLSPALLASPDSKEPVP